MKTMNIQKNPHRYFTKPDTIARSFKGGRASERTFSMWNNIGKVLSVIPSQWLNVS